MWTSQIDFILTTLCSGCGSLSLRGLTSGAGCTGFIAIVGLVRPMRADFTLHCVGVQRESR